MTQRELGLKKLGGRSWEVVYGIFKSPIKETPSRCVFSGIKSPGNECSSINAAEEIISSIAKEEGLNTNKVEFFDLQTYLFYSNKRSGEIEFDKVTGFNLGENIKWHPCECPQMVRETFKEFIGIDSSRRS